MPEKTNIEITKEVWRELNQRKIGPGDSFDDVLRRLLELDEAE